MFTKLVNIEPKVTASNINASNKELPIISIFELNVEAVVLAMWYLRQGIFDPPIVLTTQSKLVRDFIVWS